MNCSICKNDVRDKYGHNAQPINNGRCCENCNYMFVIPKRIKDMEISNNG